MPISRRISSDDWASSIHKHSELMKDLQILERKSSLPRNGSHFGQIPNWDYINLKSGWDSRLGTRPTGSSIPSGITIKKPSEAPPTPIPPPAVPKDEPDPDNYKFLDLAKLDSYTIADSTLALSSPPKVLSTLSPPKVSSPLRSLPPLKTSKNPKRPKTTENSYLLLRKTFRMLKKFFKSQFLTYTK